MLYGVTAVVVLTSCFHRLLRGRKIIDDGVSIDRAKAVQSTLPTIRNLSPDSVLARSVSATCQSV
jgi:hypothetical protein